MVTLHLGAWISLGLIWWGNDGIRWCGLTILDWTCVLVVIGCTQTIWYGSNVSCGRWRKEIQRGIVEHDSTTALQSEIFHTYTMILRGADGGRGGVVALKWGFRKNVISIWATYRSWLVMAPLVIGVYSAGGLWSLSFSVCWPGLGFKEFARATGLYGDWWMTGAAYLGIARSASLHSFRSLKAKSRGTVGMDCLSYSRSMRWL